MDLRYYFSLFFRRIKEISAISILFVFLSLFFISFIPEKYTTTVIATIGSQRPENIDFRDYTVYETIHGADNFSETIQGWTKSTNFNEEIKKSGKIDEFSITTRTQEKQNLLAEITSDSKENSEKASEAFLAVLKNRLDEYNSKTNSTFVIGQKFDSTSKNVSNVRLLIFVSFLVGLILSTLFFYLYEYLLGICSFAPQAEKILKIKALDILNKNFKEENFDFIKSYLKTLDKDYIFSNIGFYSKKFEDKIKFLFKKSYYPNLLSKIDILKNAIPILFIKLGSTKVEELKRFKNIYKEELILIIVK